MRLIKAIGSLSFAVFLISTFAVILIVSTVLESLHGTPFAQRAFYEAKWFDAFLALVWVNIFCATLSRWPFQKRHTGFIVTHIGILTLLIGTLITRLAGAEGQMTLVEGEQWNRIAQKGHDLLVAPEKGPGFQFRLPDRSSPLGARHRLKVPGYDLELFFHGLSDRAGSRIVVKGGNEFFNPAVQFTISSDRVGVRQQLWLIAHDPENPYAEQMEMGPALFKVEDAEDAADMASKPAPTPDPARLVIYDGHGHPIDNIDLVSDSPEGSILKEAEIAGGRYTVSDVRYLPFALVRDNRLINDPASGKWNPAVEFTIRDSKGVKEKHTRFALFPDFDSLHGKETPNQLDLRVELRVPEPKEHAESEKGRPELVFSASEKTGWTWRSVKSDGTVKSGTAEAGGSFETGWMDMKVTVDRIESHAVVSRVVGELPEGADTGNGAEPEPGARLSYKDKDGGSREDWVLLSRPLDLRTPTGRWTVSLTDRSREMPFVLQLKDFRKVDYPGTSNPSSFESDVTLWDKARNVKIEKTIRMNEPLDYAGWRIFQSSYVQDPQFGEASVFTIAKNPGIGLTYAGALILLLGVILLFYIQPFSSGSHVH